MTPITSIFIILTTPNTLVTHHQSPNPDPAHKKLMRTGACFIYKKPGYITIKCLEKIKGIHELDTEQGKDLSLPETRPGTPY